jgi:ribosomal protein L20
LLDEFENELIEKEKFFKDQSKKYQEMKEKHKWFVDYKFVLIRTQEIMNQNAGIEYAFFINKLQKDSKKIKRKYLCSQTRQNKSYFCLLE